MGDARAGGGGGGAGVTSGLVITSGVVDASIRDVNNRFGFEQPRGTRESDEGVLSHVGATQGASTQFQRVNQPNARVTTRSERITAAQAESGQSSTRLTTRITGTRGDSEVTIRSEGPRAGQANGPRVDSVRVTARARGRNMDPITRRPNESANSFRGRVRNGVSTFFDRTALKTVED